MGPSLESYIFRKRGNPDVPRTLDGCPGPLGVFKMFVQKIFVLIFRPLHFQFLNTDTLSHDLRKRLAFHVMAQTMVCSIISGSMAERTTMVGAVMFNTLVALLHALAVRFTWGGVSFAQNTMRRPAPIETLHVSNLSIRVTHC